MTERVEKAQQLLNALDSIVSMIDRVDHGDTFREAVELEEALEVFLREVTSLRGEPGSITCPVCNRTSHHPTDVKYGYCGFCHAYTSSPIAGITKVTGPAHRKGE